MSNAKQLTLAFTKNKKNKKKQQKTYEMIREANTFIKKLNSIVSIFWKLR